MLLAIAAGSLIALPLSGLIVSRYGSRRTVTVMVFTNAAALAVVAVGYLIGVVPVVAGLFVFGFAQGAWDVAMNVQGALVERRLGRAIMPRFHAGFSVGTVGGALVGAAMVALGVPVTVHLGVAAVLIAAIVPLAVRGFLPDANDPDHADQQDGWLAPPGAERLAGAADPAGRHLRAVLRLRRGHRQRLDQHRPDRRLPDLRRGRHARLRRVPGGDDRRTVVRAQPARPLRPRRRRSG